jgi:hypothetical protein
VHRDGSAAARVRAEVGGRRVAADVLLYPHLDEEVLALWSGGHAYEFRCGVGLRILLFLGVSLGRGTQD